SDLALRPLAFNSAELLLTVTPPVGAAPGNYPVTLTAESSELPGVQGSDAAQLEVLARGVTAAISPQSTTLSPEDSGAWSVTVTNRGSVADTFDLAVSGLLAGSATLTPSSVSLNPGQSQVVQLNSGPLPFVYGGPSQFNVTAQSTGDSRVRDEDKATVTFEDFEGVSVGWQPVSQTVTSLSATFTLLITNTGNIATVYTFDVAGAGLTASPQLAQFSIPPHSTVANMVTLRASGVGTYPFTGSAVSNTRAASDSADGTLVVHAPLAITLAQFDAVQQGSNILVTWETASEIGNLGYNLWRGTSPAGPDIQLNSSLIPSQSPGGLGGFVYTWEDQLNLAPDTEYYYWLEDVDFEGTVTRHGPVSVVYATPTAVTIQELSASSSPTAIPPLWWVVAVVSLALAMGSIIWRRNHPVRSRRSESTRFL
ncbi:MAG: hypothetical protein KDH86_18295, partial [Anaerolineae bacterium]|nr:hypothetical protein [Anaerolineae bacterium]